jgi:hypothetical protein
MRGVSRPAIGAGVQIFAAQSLRITRVRSTAASNMRDLDIQFQAIPRILCEQSRPKGEIDMPPKPVTRRGFDLKAQGP